jgi:AP-1 complex subunit beta-1
VERILPRLAHNNPAVILAAVKVILKCSDLLSDKEHKKQVMKKLAGPLVTLLGNEPEI